MIELLEHLEVLKSPTLRLNELTMAGVAFGSSAGSFPIEKVVEVTLSPIVKSSSWSADKGSTYFGSSGEQLTSDFVIQSVIESSGVLHFQEKVSFRINAGQVVSFAIYGGHLKDFGYIENMEQLFREFGRPDRSTKLEAYGDLMGYENYYENSQMLIVWDGSKSEISAIRLGQGQHANTNA